MAILDKTGLTYFWSKINNLFARKTDLTNGTIVPASVDVDGIYPVGAIYTSTVSTSPASLFGGSWEQIKDKFLLTAGDNYSAGSTGGEANHVLSKNEIPSHSHSFSGNTGYMSGNSIGYLNFRPRATMSASGNTSVYDVSGDPSGLAFSGSGNYPQAKINVEHTHSFSGNTSAEGGGASHNNMPPYLVVHAWKRIA